MTVRFSTVEWTFDRSAAFVAYAPAYEYIGSAEFSAIGLRLSPGEKVEMELIDARCAEGSGSNRRPLPASLLLASSPPRLLC